MCSVLKFGFGGCTRFGNEQSQAANWKEIKRTHNIGRNWSERGGKGLFK